MASCCKAAPNQFFFAELQRPLLHHCPASHPSSESHLASMFSSAKHAPFLQLPDWHSESLSQVKPVPFFACLQPGNSGGQSVPPGPEQGFGAGLPGKWGDSPAISVFIG